MNSLSKLIPTPIRKLLWFGSGSSCDLSFMVLFLLATGSAFSQPKANLVRYEKDVLPLLDKYCMDCHDSETKKGRFDLENLVPDMLSDDDVLERWRLVEEQLHFGEMPPEKKKQSAKPKRQKSSVQPVMNVWQLSRCCSIAVCT